MEKKALFAATHFDWICCCQLSLLSIVQPRYVQWSTGETHVPPTVIWTGSHFFCLQKTINTVLAPLKASFTSRPHFAAASHMSYRFFTASFNVTAEVIKTESSAYAIILNKKEKFERRKKSIKIFQRKGESTLPCGQPTDRREDIEMPMYSSLADLSLKKLRRILTRYSGQPFFNKLCRIAGCHAASNALLISKNATHEKRFAAFLFSKVETSERVAVSVDFPAKKPC